MPQLSVIVPVYNTEKYLRECIESILAQTFSDFELILVDDGSPDGSGAICDEYAEKDNRILVIHQENGGVTSARKAGVRAAKGKWISFVDSDDWIHAAMFEQMVGKTTETSADMVICDVSLEYGEKTELLPTLAEEGFYNKDKLKDKIYPTMLLDARVRRPGVLGSSCNKLFCRSLVEKVFWQVDDSFVYGEDALFCYGALLESDGIFVLHSPLYYYRQHSGSAMHQYNGKKCYENALRSYYAFREFLQNRGFDMQKQLSSYIAVNAVGVIRRVLLFDLETPLRQRLKQAREFLSDALVHASLSENGKLFQSRKEQWKLQLAKKRRMTLLYVFFAVREGMLGKK